MSEWNNPVLQRPGGLIISTRMPGGVLAGLDLTALGFLGGLPAPREYYYPVIVGVPLLVQQAFIVNGVGSVGTNFDIGLYTSQGNLLVSTGSTAQIAVTLQPVNVVHTLINPGCYYIGFASNGASNYHYQQLPQNCLHAMLGILQGPGVFPLPATATMNAATVFPALLDVGFVGAPVI